MEERGFNRRFFFFGIFAGAVAAKLAPLIPAASEPVFFDAASGLYLYGSMLLFTSENCPRNRAYIVNITALEDPKYAGLIQHVAPRT